MKPKIKTLILISLLMIFTPIIAQQDECLCFEIIREDPLITEGLIAVELEDDFCEVINSEMVLVKKSKIREQTIPFQLEKNNSKIWFKHKSNSQKAVTYCLKRSYGLANKTPFNFQKRNGDLNFNYGDQSLIGYRYEMKLPPKGVNKLFQKSGYIHPVLSPKGDTLTRIQPPDHYHHYGIWGPWTRTKIDETGVDFWNLKEGQGTVLFKEFKNITSGQVFCGFVAKQEHLNLTGKDPQIALNENLKVKVWKSDNPNQYFIDYATAFKTPLENGILFEAYRYGGGLGFRFKAQWHKDNCYVLTSEGKDRQAADGTEARWCMVYGESTDKKGTNGILFMSHPDNRSHPEPMRVWPITANRDRGDMFFEFCPIRHKEWKIEQNKTYQLNYRMLVFEGTISPEEAEAHWKAFALPPQIKINKNPK